MPKFKQIMKHSNTNKIGKNAITIVAKEVVKPIPEPLIGHKARKEIENAEVSAAALLNKPDNQAEQRESNPHVLNFERSEQHEDATSSTAMEDLNRGHDGQNNSHQKKPDLRDNNIKNSKADNKSREAKKKWNMYKFGNLFDIEEIKWLIINQITYELINLAIRQGVSATPKIYSFFYPEKPENNYSTYKNNFNEMTTIIKLFKRKIESIPDDEVEIKDIFQQEINLIEALHHRALSLFTGVNATLNLKALTDMIITMKFILKSLTSINEKFPIIDIEECMPTKIDTLEESLSKNKRLLSEKCIVRARDELKQFIDDFMTIAVNFQPH